MSNMIGKKSGVDWSKALPDATHYNTRNGFFYKKEGDDWYWHDTYQIRDWTLSGNTESKLSPHLITKEEDLGMPKKVVKTVDDLEVGMFLSNGMNKYCVLGTRDGEVQTILVFSNWNYTYSSDLDCFDLWSYIYNGEYTPIVKETEQEKQIRELEETINKAQEQIKKLKGDN